MTSPRQLLRVLAATLICGDSIFSAEGIRKSGTKESLQPQRIGEGLLSGQGTPALGGDLNTHSYGAQPSEFHMNDSQKAHGSSDAVHLTKSAGDKATEQHSTAAKAGASAQPAFIAEKRSDEDYHGAFFPESNMVDDGENGEEFLNHDNNASNVKQRAESAKKRLEKVRTYAGFLQKFCTYPREGRVVVLTAGGNNTRSF